MAETMQERLTAYLTDAHSIEEQALAQLRSLPRLDGAEQLTGALQAHLPETEGHEQTLRRLLEGRGAKPSWFKDAVMKLGGKGFVLFARLNPDTPGKLLAHALSYEALEEASYALLGQVADRAGETKVAEAVGGIEASEVAMKERLATCYDEAVAASFAAVGRDDLREQVRKYLADAHALETQAIELLERASGRASGPLGEAYQHHLVETRDQAEAVAARLEEIGGDPSTLKDAAMRLGAVNWTLFFEAHPDTPGKLAAFAYAFEHLEVGGYEQLARVAERAGDGDTRRLVDGILEQERAAATTLRELFPEAAQLALHAR
jgi:ferritin-like metal-binding protein YciE